MLWLLVSSRHHPGQGGIGAYVTRFCEAARAAGWRVELLTRPGAHHPPAARVHEIRTPDDGPGFHARIPALRRIERIRPYRYGLWSLAVARRLLEFEPRPDVIEFVDCQAEGYVSLCSRRVRRRFRGVPMIVHAHTPMFLEETINGADERRFGRAVYHRWEKAALRAADGIIASSRLMARRLGIRRTVVIPCPLEKGIAQAGHPRAGGYRILFVGSAQPRKGVDVWGRSLNIVLRRAPDAMAELVGPDTMTAPGGKSMIAHVRNVIAPDLRGRFIRRGELTHEETLRAIAGASLVVVPSRFESFGYAGAEALLCGRPVVLSDQVGLAEWAGRITTVPAGDADALARAQLRVLADLPAAEDDSERWRARLVRACSPAHHLQRRASFVEALAEDPARPDSGAHAAPDTMERMQRFLATVERAEHNAGDGSTPSRVAQERHALR
jgi:glycosyltransferase involved in cell wall biosynthesis